MDVISLLLPTRQRPSNLTRLVESINATATHPELIELCVYVDEDDPSYDTLELDIEWIMVRGPRLIGGIVNLSAMWNKCYEICTGNIIMHCGDDICFRTEGWDDTVREAFDAISDKLLFVFGDDGYQTGNNFGTHGFISREWVNVVGYLFPPLFSSDWNDAFLNDVAKLIDRHQEIPIYTEHMHFMAGKAEIDVNTQERLERHRADGVDILYHTEEVQNMIREAADKLREVMHG